MKKDYDSSWDFSVNEDGNLPVDEDAFDKIYVKWEKRSWESWLLKNLNFPFTVERMEDADYVYFTDIAEKAPFRLGHTMKVINIEVEDEFNGVILKVKEGRNPKKNENFWPVREYVVWFANR